MTRAEYLEYVQEALAFENSGESPPGIDTALIAPEAAGLFPCNPQFQLRDTPEVCKALKMAHAEYCARVETILFPERAVQVAADLHGYKLLNGVQEDEADSKKSLWQLQDEGRA